MSRTLIVAPAWIGDMVMAQSLVAALKAQDPDSVIDLIAPPWTAPLGERMPGVRQSLVSEQAHGKLSLMERWRLGRSLKGRYDLALVLPRSLKSALIPLAAGIPQRRGYVGEFRYGVLTDPRNLDKTKLPRTVDQFVALADPAAEADPAPPMLTADKGAGEALADRLGAARARPILALCPGAEYGPAKQWPAGHFAELGRMHAAKGETVWIFGSPKEQGLCERLAQAIGPSCVSFAGRTKLLESLDLLSLCSSVVSNDSGLMHVASALGLPVVGIFGSTSPGHTPPMGARAVTAEIELECRPCFQRTCPLGHLNCLVTLEPSLVEARLASAVAQPA